MIEQEPVSALAEFVKEHLDSCASTFMDDGLCTCGRNQALSELKDYELRLDLLAKGATWEHEENERLKDEIEKLKEERDAWKRSSELYERESNHWYLKVLERDSEFIELEICLENVEKLVKKWKAETDDADAEIVDRHDRELTAYVATMNGCIEELAVALGMENKK